MSMNVGNVPAVEVTLSLIQEIFHGIVRVLFLVSENN